MWSSARLRSDGVVRFQVLKASLAEASARWTSSGEDTGASAKTSPVLGSTSGAVLPPSEPTCSPWMKFSSTRVTVPLTQFAGRQSRWVTRAGTRSQYHKADVNAADEGRLRSLSLWWDGLPGPCSGRAPLGRDIDVDVAVVGGGFTGLWTAYSLLQAAPCTRVALLESQVAGFGASGRNGGWCSALFAASGSRIAREHGAGAAIAMQRAMNGTVDEVGRAAAAEGIDCRFEKGGTVVAGRTQAQVRRAEAEVAESRLLGF